MARCRPQGVADAAFVGAQTDICDLGESMHTAFLATEPHAPGRQDGLRALIGRSAAMDAVRTFIVQAAPHPWPVLLMGETGTGKDLAAQALARLRGAARMPFIALNCGALSGHLVESELFGHERGAFTGAVGRRAGAFEAAHGGTLFLDEVGELPLPQQTQLLRVLESGEIRRVGATHAVHVQVRVVAATHRCLAQEVQAGRFRADLFHRLHVLPCTLPALRHHKEDLAELVAHFLKADCRSGSREGNLPELSRAAACRLQAHHWPGNVRELRHVLQRGWVLAAGGCIEAEHLVFADLVAAAPQPCEGIDAQPLVSLQALAQSAVLNALRVHGGNRTQAARTLKVSRSTLHRRLLELGLTPQSCG
jgi:DNA-binding NtrC family response regulator